jgi:hypothetical protein
LDQLGTTRALTTLSPILPGRLRQLIARLKVVRYTPGLGRPLLQLAFVHYARWMILDGLPPARGTGGWYGLRWKYLLFESNYDGSQDDYLRAFADVLPARLAKLWGSCFGFENATRPAPGAHYGLAAGGFRTFVERNKLHVLDFYAAYPWSTATDVRQAIALHELGADISRVAGDDSIERLGSIGPTALGPTPPRLVAKQRLRAFLDPWVDAVRGQYGVNPLSIVTPLPAGHSHEVRRACDNGGLLGGLRGSDTHFARVAIIPRHMADLGQPNPDVLPTPYLLFTSDAWGSSYDQVEAIRTAIGDVADFIWGACDGYPGHEDASRFHAWVDSYTLPTKYYLAGYAPYPVSTIDRLLRERAAVGRTYELEPHPSLAQLLGELDTGDD